MPGNDLTSERNLDGYGASMIDWARVRAVLDEQLTQASGTGGPGRHTPWLTTSNPDGSPHVMPVGVISVDGTWYFSSGPGTGKSRNIARDPRCVISVATHPFDLVVEGRAERVIEGDELRRVADAYAAQGLAGERGRRRPDRRVQRPIRRAPAMERLPARPLEGVRPRLRRAVRRHPIRSRPTTSGPLTPGQGADTE